jgi:hypothetical protein
MRQSHLKAVAISNEMLFSRAIVVAEHLLVYIAKQVKGLYRNVCAFQSALEQTPKVFESIGVNLPCDIPLGVVNRLSV